jgi:hypothetical protein
MRCGESFVVARDRANNRVLVGGLGVVGVGEMWFNDEGKHSDYRGYDSAPEQVSQDPVKLAQELREKIQQLFCV